MVATPRERVEAALLSAAGTPAPRSMALGCVCRVATGVLFDGGSLALLEPDTEGRLAASLARLGEGPTVAWLRSMDCIGSWLAPRRVPSVHDRSIGDLFSTGQRHGRAGDRGALHGRGISGRAK